MDSFQDLWIFVGYLDLGFTRNPFTWSNGKDTSLVKARLDPCLATVGWMSMFPSVPVCHISTINSNH